MRALVIGGGIGGFATALGLAERGIEAEVFEQAPAVRELGVGINLLPHAVKELDELGLLDRLDAAGVRTRELLYCNRFGQRIWAEPRGLEAGYAWPQFSIHRGRLQGLLYEATLERLGAGARPPRPPAGAASGRTPWVWWPASPARAGRSCRLARRPPGRGRRHPLGGPRTASPGRGAAQVERPHAVARGGRGRAVPRRPHHGGGRGPKEKVVLYPISREAALRGRSLTNWAVWARLGDGSGPPPRARTGAGPAGSRRCCPPGALALRPARRAGPDAQDAGLLRVPDVRPRPAGAGDEGRVTLLGDAAHPMYPVGSNGAAQAIIDGRALAKALAAHRDVAAALRAYEAERLPATSRIVLSNRQMGPSASSTSRPSARPTASRGSRT